MLLPSAFIQFTQRLFQRNVMRTLLTLLLAWAAAWLCIALKLPLPWMIGPLLLTAGLTMAGGPTASWTPLRNSGQWLIGGALGLYFTPQMVSLVAGLWWAMALGIVWALALGFLGWFWPFVAPVGRLIVWTPWRRKPPLSSRWRSVCDCLICAAAMPAWSN
jgi:uncharacterized membrane protein AbrB (regulator of aidB expression)